MQVAVIGCGKVSVVHLDPISKSHDVQLMAVCDSKPERAKQAGEKYAVPWFTSYEDVLNLQPDLIHICTPHDSHAEIAIAASKRGIHVLTEKPMALNLEQADRMIETAGKLQVKLGVIFQNRYNPSSQAVYDLVKSGQLGKILGCRVFVTWNRSDEYYSTSDWKGTWEQEGGGVLIDQAIHTIDLMQWIVGEIDYLEGSMDNRNHDLIDVEDVAEATIYFKNGAIGSLYACNYYSFDAPVLLEIHGENGLARIEMDDALIRIDGEPERLVSRGDFIPAVGKSYWGVSHKTQIDKFHRAVLENGKVDICGQEGRPALEIVRAIYYSASNGNCQVKFPFQEPVGFTPPSLTRD